MILVTGATGLVGRPLIELLLKEGATVRAITRDPDSAALPAEVEVIAGDPRRPETIASAMGGVSTVFVNSRAVGDAADALVTLAAEHGVRRFVALSALNIDDPDDYQPSRFRGDRNREAEAAVAGSGLPWVSLRPLTFASNSLLSWGAQIRAGDVVRAPFAEFTESPIHERDLAEVAARALLDENIVTRRGRRIELTGPQCLSHRTMVTIIGEAIGKPLRYQEIPPEVARQGLIAGGAPEPFVTALLARYTREIGYPSPVTGEVERILGRPARTFAAWAAEHAADFLGQGGGGSRSTSR